MLLALLAWPAGAVALSAMVDGAEVDFEIVAENLDAPIFLASPAGDPRQFIVDQYGAILVIKDGSVLEEPFLEIGDRIVAGGERGLLGLAFHPDYDANGRFFVNYTDLDGDTQVVAFRVSADPDRADPGSAETILSVAQPASNHNGGWIGFGPDGYLYIGMGDGGGAGDPNRNGQNPNVLLAKILRIDVDTAAPYAIPPGNPFAGGGGAPEVFLLGVRNPWRNSFDGDLLYIADVGQRRFEEITVVNVARDAGANLGWNVAEGEACFAPRENCEVDGLVPPDHAYPRDDGCTVIGGYVYRGAAIPALRGRYFFADYCLGSVRSFRFVGDAITDFVDMSDQTGRLGGITSFGVDADGEIYVLFDDTVAKIVPAT